MLSANQIEDIKLQAFSCEPSILPGVCQVYPLSMGEIIKIGLNNYSAKLETLLLTSNTIAELLKKKVGVEIDSSEIDVLQYLLLSTEQRDTFFLELESTFSTFIKEDILFLPEINSIAIGDPKEKRLITSENFEDFQNILRIQNRRKIAEPPPENETPWERKRRLNNEKIAEIKRKKAQKQSNGEEAKLQDLLEMAKVYGIDYKNESLYAFYSLLRRYEAKEKWDQDLQMLCAGADNEKIKTKYWGGSLED